MGLESAHAAEGRSADRRRRGRAGRSAARPLRRQSPSRLRPPPARATFPKIADKADDLEAIKKAVDDAAAVGGGLWLSYLFVLFYLAVAAGAVTHADLFFENPVKLPFLNIELPLLAFFFLAPILFLIVHAYTLVHLVMLTDKAKRFHQALYRQIGDERPTEASERRKTIRDGLRRQLPSNIFVQFLAGPEDVRESVFGWLLRAIAWVTLVIAPVLLLLLMQIQFLPFHNSFITWTHRIALVADLGSCGGCGARSCRGASVGGRSQRLLGMDRPSASRSAPAPFCSPGRWRPFPASGRKTICRTGDSSRRATRMGQPTRCPSTICFSISGRRHDPPPHEPLLQHARPARLQRLRRPRASTIRRRSKGGICLSRPRPRFEGRDLRSRQPAESRLRGRAASGRVARRRAASGRVAQDAQLQGASLESRSFRARRSMTRSFRARRSKARSFRARRLTTRSFRAHRSIPRSFRARRSIRAASGRVARSAQLQGASLNDAQLQGASLDDAQLQGASLAGAQLQGASLQSSSPAGDRSFACSPMANHGGAP